MRTISMARTTPAQYLRRSNNIKRCWPLPRTTQNSHHFNPASAGSVSHGEGSSRDYKFAGSFHPLRATEIGMLHQEFGCREDASQDFFCRRRIIGGYIVVGSPEVAYRRFGPANLHPRCHRAASRLTLLCSTTFRELAWLMPSLICSICHRCASR